MRFLAPQILNYIPLLLLGPIAWYFFERRAAEKLRLFASPQLLVTLIGGRTFERRRAKVALLFFASVFALLALARPQVGMHEEVVQSQGLDLAFLLDVSNSMLTEDTVPSRLKKAKHIIRNFVDRMSGDRVGVVAFAGSAYPAVPLTADYDFLRQTLEILDENSVSNQGTNLARALQVGADLLVRGGLNDEVEGSRVLIVLSDGEAQEGDEAALAPKLKELGVRVFTIGVGGLKGAPIPLRDPSGYMRGYKKDQSGNIIATRLETKSLEAIASKTDGKFYVASANEGEVEEILSELSSMDRVSGAGRRVVVYDELFQYPLGIAVLLLLVMLLLADVKRVKPLVAALVFLVAANASAASNMNEYSNTRRGVEAYGEKDYAAAIQHFGKAQAANPDSAANHLNLGDALLKSGSAEGAAAEFGQVTKSKDGNEAARGAFNLGKAYESQKNPEMALRAYQEGLARLQSSPKPDSEVEQRLKRALEQAQQQKQQQQQKDDKQQNDKDGKPKDQKEDQKKDQQKYEIPKQKPKFKHEKLSENDAKGVLKQMQEQEKKTQQRVMRGKTGKPKNDKNGKDW